MKEGKAFIDYTLPEEEFRYGRANRPPTPINYVVGYFFTFRKYVWPIIRSLIRKLLLPKKIRSKYINKAKYQFKVSFKCEN